MPPPARHHAALSVLLIAVGVALFLLLKRLGGGERITIPAAFPIMAVAVLYYGVREGSLRPLGFTADHLLRDAAVGALTFVPMMLTFILLDAAFSGLLARAMDRPETVSGTLLRGLPAPWNWVAQAAYAFALLAPAEEVVFRGLIQGRLQESVGPVAAILIQSTIFGLAHGVPAALAWDRTLSIGYFLLGFSGGVILGSAFYLTGNSIVAPWIGHALADSPLAVLILVATGRLPQDTLHATVGTAWP
ncbi:MAG TPA: CPBP family intramembrane metalloprotease [Candidatus Korarchaeota archaeon]|nr:CPBP family intramembrane metalloprotease [Candidatus Korarchaeota archaeon]